jgi:hypothetical protein
VPPLYFSTGAYLEEAHIFCVLKIFGAGDFGGGDFGTDLVPAF